MKQRYLVNFLGPFVAKYRWAIVGIVMAWFIVTLIFVFRLKSTYLETYFDHLKMDDPLS
jgi:uncharacterized membrane protein